jgi:uncharacterized membrane protein YsdA (DUF1294 family)/cold shock CspA family protein
MRTKGKLTTWHDDKGYGFITPLAGGGQVFVHIKAFGNRSRRPAVGEVVSYALSADKQGRPCADRATLAGDRLRTAPKRAGGSRAMLAAALFLGAIGGAAVTDKVPPLVFGLYLVASLITFAVYAADKTAAVTGTWRTPENTLHLLALIGGWPGALIAQQKLRHKSSKTSFRAVFWTTVLANCAALVWLSTPTGTALLRLWIAQARHSLAI